MRPPGYEPGELPTAPLRDVFFLSGCKGTTIFWNMQIFREKSGNRNYFGTFLSNYLVVSELFSNFAHYNLNVQYTKNLRGEKVCQYQRQDRSWWM